MEFASEEVKYASLLINLKTVIENLLGCTRTKSWSVYGSVQRLHVAITEILGNGFRFLKENGKPDFWVFIQGLSWLQPQLAASPSFFNHSISSLHSPTRNTDKALVWLCHSIENRNLSEKLSWLLSDHEHLLSCYNATAFLRQRQYSEATLICLRALEQRQLSLLATINADLYSNRKITTRKHRRCLSYPEPETLDAKTWLIKKATTPIIQEDAKELEPMKMVVDDVTMEARINRFHDRIINSVFKSTKNEKKAKKYIRCHMLKRWFSSEDVRWLSYNNKRMMARRPTCTTMVPSKKNDKRSLISNLLELKYKYDYREDENSVKTGSAIPEVASSAASKEYASKNHQDIKKTRESKAFKLPFLPRNGEESNDELARANTKKSFIENGGSAALPMSIGSFPLPSPGQSIISFLTSSVFLHMNAELDRENAHFNISEAIIATLEQVKFNQQLNQEDETREESDEEINNLKRAIRLRRWQKQNAECPMPNVSSSHAFNTPDNIVTTDQSVSSLNSSVYSYSNSEGISTDCDEDEQTVKTSTENSELSVSKVSFLSENIRDFGRKTDLSASAENVAISLLRNFKENQLPAASEIEWLVSERDAPQRILPLPSNIQIDHTSDTNDKFTLLRGTNEWAPPRPQIIFTPHPPPSRKLLLEKQHYRCAGCGTTVAPKYASKLRYCDYLGRYFCASCHNEQTAVIPGRVLSKWDFNKYPVSNFSHQLLDQMATDPLFNVMDLNGELYRHVRLLQKIRLLRVALFYLKDFILSCKYCDRLQEMILAEPQHIYTDPDSYSMVDFDRVKNGKWLETLTLIVESCKNHVNQCELCQARGFMCEVCDKQEIIYPWELNHVVRCNQCGSCHHIKCYQRQMTCPKCMRISKRNTSSETSIDPSLS